MTSCALPAENSKYGIDFSSVAELSCFTIFVGFGSWLLVLLKFCRQSDFLLSSKSFEGLKLSVKALHLLSQVDVVVLEEKTRYSNNAMGLNLIWAAVFIQKLKTNLNLFCMFEQKGAKKVLQILLFTIPSISILQYELNR